MNAYAIFNYKDSNPDARAPKAWTFEASNDGETWTELDSQSGETGWKANEMRFYKAANENAYSYYKLNVTANNGNQYLQFNRLEYYDVDIAAADPIIQFGTAFVASEYTSVQISQPYEIRPEATVDSVELWIGDDEGELAESEIPVSFVDGLATMTVSELTANQTKYWKLRFTLSYFGMTKIADSPVTIASTRVTAIWSGGTGSWTTGDWGIGRYPSDANTDVLIDGDSTSPSTVTLTLTVNDPKLSAGSVEVTEGDVLNVNNSGKKNVGGTFTATVNAITNNGSIFVYTSASGNGQHAELFCRTPNAFYNGPGGLIKVTNTSSRNQCNPKFGFVTEGARNEGEIYAVQTASDRNRTQISLLSGGEMINNGLIHAEIVGSHNGSYSHVVVENGVKLGGSGVVFLDMEKMQITDGGNTRMTTSGVYTNGIAHTIKGAGTIGSGALYNEGLVLSVSTPGHALSVENTIRDNEGKAMVNAASGRLVAASAGGLYIGANKAQNSQFVNYGLLEARSGSFIAFRTGVRESADKGTTGTTVAMKQTGTWAGGGVFQMPRSLEFKEGAVLKPGDLSNETDEAGNVTYGKGTSMPGQMTFTNNLKLHETTVSEFQCRKPESGKYDAVWVNGNLTVAGTLRFLEPPSSGTYPLFTSTGTLTCDLKTLKVECAEGVKAPKLKLVESTYAVEQQKVVDDVPVVDEETGEPVMETVYLQCQRIEATWMNGFTITLR